MAIRPLSRDTGTRIPTPVCSLARNDKQNHDSVYPRLVQDSFVGAGDSAGPIEDFPVCRQGGYPKGTRSAALHSARRPPLRSSNENICVVRRAG